MAIVRDYIAPNGAHIIVHDDCYRDITPEENARRKREVRAVMDRIAWSAAEREYRRRQAEAAQGDTTADPG